MVQALKLWTAGPPCEGEAGWAVWRRSRVGAGCWRGVRDHSRWPAGIF